MDSGFVPSDLLSDVGALAEREKQSIGPSYQLRGAQNPAHPRLQQQQQLPQPPPPQGPARLSTRSRNFAPSSSALDSAPSLADLLGGVTGAPKHDSGGAAPVLPPPQQQQPQRGAAKAKAKAGGGTEVAAGRENAFAHAGTAKRLAHLVGARRPQAQQDSQRDPRGELAFLYAADRRPPSPDLQPSQTDGLATGRREESAGAGVGDGGVDLYADPVAERAPALDPNDLVVVLPMTNEVPARDAGPRDPQLGGTGGGAGGGNAVQPSPSLKPTTRKEVALLKHTMLALLRDIGCDFDQEYPTEMHAFLGVIQEEQKVYDAVFAEVIRQVTVNMIERGELLAEIRRRYGGMFARIPRHVRHLHVELVAQRKLNRRLTEELLRAKESVAALWGELQTIRQHDEEASGQAREAQEKLVAVLTRSDNADDLLEEYHKLYRMQRDRLEEAVRAAEREKKGWIDAALSLALRIGQEHDVVELAQLQESELARVRATNHMVVIISNTNDDSMAAIEKKIEEWRGRIVRLSQAVVEEDQLNIETLAKMQRDMKMVLNNLDVNEPKDPIEAEHPLLKAFHLYDVKSLAEYLARWVEQVTTVAIRFTSDRDITFQEELAAIRKVAESWVEDGTKLLRRHEKNANSKDYAPLSEMLAKVSAEIGEWMTKLGNRVSENIKLHHAIVSWMVNILIKSTKEKPSESWDHELLQLVQEVISFNLNIMRDSADIEMISDDKKDLRTTVKAQSEVWMNTAKKLLSLMRKKAAAAGMR
ncbi:Axonemal dynein light chain domain-containing protein 1 [Cladochytrium tenue]|nr:Axonemal dynein light chain domain-containing protein 1 [Cladochytrium tenue]